MEKWACRTKNVLVKPFHSLVQKYSTEIANFMYKTQKLPKN